MHPSLELGEMELTVKKHFFKGVFIPQTLVAIAMAAAGLPNIALAQSVNIYSSREPKLIQPVLDAFKKETGITANTIFAQNGLEERILAEGASSPADLILTVDVSKLVQASAMGITQRIESQLITKAVPEAYRDRDNHWFGATLRARVIYASKSRVETNNLEYEDLADPRWKGKICMRDGQNVYNSGLFASAVANMGAIKAEAWLRGIKANLAKKPSGGDRDIAKDIASGQCDIGLGNTYYVGLMMNREPERRPWVDAIKVIYPTFAGGGTHVNISGFAVAKYAPNRSNAVRLAEWLVGDTAQALYASQNFEHPIRNGISLDPTVASFGVLKPDPLPLIEIAKNRKTASELVDKIEFNAGP
jgi:iron(III) transport system substrate-binding protein